ncbi:hypothetical protein D3C85_1449060 [compost metagenome]
MHECRRNAQPLLLAAGKIFNIAVCLVLKLNVTEKLHRVNSLAVCRTKHLNHFSEPCLVLKCWRLWLHTDDIFDLIRLGGDVNTVDNYRTTIDWTKRLHHFKRRGLTSAVWPKDAENFTFFH